MLLQVRGENYWWGLALEYVSLYYCCHTAQYHGYKMLRFSKMTSDFWAHSMRHFEEAWDILKRPDFQGLGLRPFWKSRPLKMSPNGHPKTPVTFESLGQRSLFSDSESCEPNPISNNSSKVRLTDIHRFWWPQGLHIGDKEFFESCLEAGHTWLRSN